MSKRYTVIGSQPVLDHQPGDSFTAELPADQERFLTLIGALKVEHTEIPASSPEGEKMIREASKYLNVKSYKTR